MKNKILSNLPYIFCLALGLLTFAILALPFLIEYINNSFYSEILEHFNGYNFIGYLMNLLDVGYAQPSGSIILIIHIIFIVLTGLMTIYGIIGILIIVFDDGKLSNVFQGTQCKKVASIAIYSHLFVTLLDLVFLIVFCKKGTIGNFGYRLGEGIYTALSFALACSVFTFILSRNKSQTIK